MVIESDAYFFYLTVLLFSSTIKLRNSSTKQGGIDNKNLGCSIGE